MSFADRFLRPSGAAAMRPVIRSVQDEVELYLGEPVVDIDPLVYWKV